MMSCVKMPSKTPDIKPTKVASKVGSIYEQNDSSLYPEQPPEPTKVQSMVAMDSGEGSAFPNYEKKRMEKNVVPNKTKSKRITDVPKKVKSSNNSEIRPGRLLYKIPDTMNLKKTYTIKIRISRDTTDKKIHVGMPNGKIDTVIKTTRKMMVLLVDPSTNGRSFSIVRGTDSIQLIGDSHTEWIYDVTPIKSGNLKLYISVAIIEDGDRKDVVYTDVVYVKSNIVYTITDFLKLYWQWIISVIIIPFIGWLYKRYNNR